MQSRENAISFLHIYILLILMSILMVGVLSSCQKDDNPVLPVQPGERIEPCEPIPPWSGIGFRPMIMDTAYYSSATINPNNQDEIVFRNNWDRNIYRLNYVTGELNLLLEDLMHFNSPHWGLNDWILYTYMNKLYKIKSNGDSLTAITPNRQGVLGRWSPSGDRYMYRTYVSDLGYLTLIANQDDEVIDTLPVFFSGKVDWFSDSLVYWNKGYYKFGDENLTYLVDSFTHVNLWAGISDTESLHYYMGLLRINRVTGASTQIQGQFPICRRYRDFVYSHQKNKLLASRVYDALMPDGRTQYVRGDIVWLNLDGTEYEVINILQFMNP